MIGGIGGIGNGSWGPYVPVSMTTAVRWGGHRGMEWDHPYGDGCLQKKTLSVSGVPVLPALLPAHTAWGIHHLSLFGRIARWNHQARSCVGGSGLCTT